MDTTWWRLPGAARFVENVLADLRAGRTVVLRLPPAMPAGLRGILREAIVEERRAGWREWRPPGAIEDAGALLDSLSHDLGGGHGPAPTMAGLLSCMCRTVVWTEVAGEPLWSAWRALLAGYTHVAAAEAPADRGLFCIAAAADLAPPTADVALGVLEWNGVIRPRDMRLFADVVLRSFQRQPLLAEIVVAVAAELAGCDTELVAICCEQSLESLLDPQRMLLTVAARRGWTADLQAPDWRRGTDDGAGGWHSAAAAVRRDDAVVARRVWRGQVGIVYPCWRNAAFGSCRGSAPICGCR